MRKILLSIISILMIIILVLCMKNGITIGSLQILSVQEIHDKDQSLTEDINKANTASDSYTTTLKKLTTDISSLAKAKKDYLDLVTVSTDSEIAKSTQTKNYTIEYLWSRVGNHATSEGVNIKMDITSSSLGDSNYKNLKFTVTGNYLAMTNFIYSLENDTSLDFTIDDFDMTTQQCTFTVKDVKIQKENTTATISSSTSTTNTNSTSGTTQNTTANTTANTTTSNTTTSSNNTTNQ